MRCLIIVLSMSISYSVIMTEACICHKMYIPVCGSDGKTYDNECEFNCALNDLKEKNSKESTAEKELHIIHYEPCRPKQEENPECACFRNFDYVCGSDGKTYNNECVLNCIVSDAKREASDKSTKELEVKVAYRGKCSEKKNEPSTVSKLLRIVTKPADVLYKGYTRYVGRK